MPPPAPPGSGLVPPHEVPATQKVTAAVPPDATLPLTVVLVRDSVPALLIPPPGRPSSAAKKQPTPVHGTCPLAPPVTVTPMIDEFEAAPTLSTCEAPPPS